MKKMFVLGSLIALVLVLGLGSCTVEHQNVEQSVEDVDSVEWNPDFVDSVEVETEIDTTL
jgi:hypothetical protein